VREHRTPNPNKEVIVIRYLRKPDILRITGWSDSTISRKEKSGLFPERYQLGPTTVAWREDEVKKWSEQQIKRSEYRTKKKNEVSH
jgi:prophage regulatory protein